MLRRLRHSDSNNQRTPCQPLRATPAAPPVCFAPPLSRPRLVKLVLPVILLIAGIAVIGCGPSAAMRSPDTGLSSATGTRANVFHLVLGPDTLATERFTRSPDRIQGEHVDQVRATRLSYVASVALDGRITSIETTRSARGSALVRAKLTLVRDTAVLEENGQRIRAIAVPPGTQFLLGPSTAITEQLFIRARRLSGDSVVMPILVLEDRRWKHATIRWIGADSAVAGYPPERESTRFRLLPSGELLGFCMGTVPPLCTVRGR